jgi:hypothetical protein
MHPERNKKPLRFRPPVRSEWCFFEYATSIVNAQRREAVRRDRSSPGIDRSCRLIKKSRRHAGAGP